MEKQSGRKKDLQTLAVVAAALLVLSLIFRKPVFAALALGLLALALASAKASARLAALWLRFSEVLGAVNAKVVLGAVYFLLLTPVAFLFRLFNGPGVKAKADPAAATYFKERKHLFVPADLQDPW